MKTKNNINWIDAAKVIAILAVLVDHTNGVLWTDYKIGMWSYFSVTLFILLSGITMYGADVRHEAETYCQSVVRGIKKILGSYFLATFIYQICIMKYFDFGVYLKFIAGFNISGPLYFVLLYIQLMLINKPLYEILSRIPGGGYADALFMCVIVLVSYFTTNYTNILDVYGGGGKLFGGTYLAVFCLGMVIAKYDLLNFKSVMMKLGLGIAAGVLSVFWWNFECEDRFALDAKLPFGYGVNPPSISLIIMAIIILIFSYGIFSFLDEYRRNKYMDITLRIIYYMGQSTMYIFLYHRLFLDLFLVPNFSHLNIWVKRIFYFTVMIAGSIMIKICVENIEKYMRKG